MSNPFTLSFGKEPTEFISRLADTDHIIDDFTSDDPVSQVYMITGVRGSGKTVMLTKIKKRISCLNNWIVVELSPVKEMLDSLAAKMYLDPDIQKIFKSAKLELSKFGLGISVENKPPVTDTETALSKMLAEIKKSGKRLLIIVDEIYKNKYTIEFASVFQILIRDGYPVFLLMTGLYEKIYDLQNEDGLTFLYRAPRIVMEPLSTNMITATYKRIFNLSTESANKMAQYTLGYPFAFQVLGYLLWENGNPEELPNILEEYDHYLEEYVYAKIWSELSAKDKTILLTMSALDKGEILPDQIKISAIRDELDMSNNEMSVYRERLSRKGLVDKNTYGTLSFKLPRFSQIIRLWS